MNINKKLIAITVLILILFSPHLTSAESIQVQAKAAIVMEASTGSVLFAKNPHLKVYPASTTKILTALLAVEIGNLDDRITVGNELNLVSPGSSLAQLKKGESFSLRELVYALMLPSGNDAAYTIAVYLARLQSGCPDLSVQDAINMFAEIMNDRAQQLGATNTHFLVPDGYHDDNHYTTAYDLALMAREAIKHPFLSAVVATVKYKANNQTSFWRNNNQLICPNSEYHYAEATGLKTGFTSHAGFCLVSSARRQGIDLITVTMDVPPEGRWAETHALLDYGFSSCAVFQLVRAEEKIETVAVSNSDYGQPKVVPLTAAQGFSTVLRHEDYLKVERVIDISEGLLDTSSRPSWLAQSSPQNEYTFRAPLAKGQKAGRVYFTLAGEELFSTDLVIAEDIAPKPWWRLNGYLLGAGLLVTCMVFFLCFIKSR